MQLMVGALGILLASEGSCRNGTPMVPHGAPMVPPQYTTALTSWLLLRLLKPEDWAHCYCIWTETSAPEHMRHIRPLQGPYKALKAWAFEENHCPSVCEMK